MSIYGNSFFLFMKKKKTVGKATNVQIIVINENVVLVDSAIGIVM